MGERRWGTMWRGGMVAKSKHKGSRRSKGLAHNGGREKQRKRKGATKEPQNGLAKPISTQMLLRKAMVCQPVLWLFCDSFVTLLWLLCGSLPPQVSANRLLPLPALCFSFAPSPHLLGFPAALPDASTISTFAISSPTRRKQTINNKGNINCNTNVNKTHQV